ncbi:excisionase family DNA binding protein [Humibacillus xanthopallidus]|uniref:Excisionase family DNA binding protein n=1 Tax=Humibacillus xanthopallidus TaxID=412689 RepID=A0A543PQD1_9MICO|nr:hypothetical protein [Humibacillus xanthopallidus]TQN46289.1 excisionase family DNA binding protein [Humibacillus xanthopallidus]
MTAATAAALLDRAANLTAELQHSSDPVDARRWESFDQTVYRYLTQLTPTYPRPTRADPGALRLHAILRDYPTPLTPAADEPHYSAVEAARLTGRPARAIRREIAAGELPAIRTGTGWQIPREALHLRSDVHPARGEDPHPLARIACTLGALTDLLAVDRDRPDRALLDSTSATALAWPVIALTLDIARHTLGHCEPDQADRPLQIARFATRALTRLAGVAVDVPIPHLAASPSSWLRREPGDQLAQALHTWARAAGTDLALTVPSVDVIRNVTNQGTHLLAALDTLLAREPLGSGAALDVASFREALRDTALALTRAGTVWGSATTGMPPSPEYVDAASTLHQALGGIVSGHDTSPGPLDRDQALATLADATKDLTALTLRATQATRQLLRSELLFAPARTLARAEDRLHARTTGRHVPITNFDAPTLVATMTAAEIKTEQLARSLREITRSPSSRFVQDELVAGPLL